MLIVSRAHVKQSEGEGTSKTVNASWLATCQMERGREREEQTPVGCVCIISGDAGYYAEPGVI